MAGVSHVYGNFGSTVTIDTDGDAWTFKLGGISSSNGPGIQMVDGAEGNIITVHGNVGTIAEFESAVALSGSDWFMSISSLAVISGYGGVYIDGGASGTTSFLVNDGQIIANGGTGVTMAPKAGSILSISNSGLISGVVGLESVRGANYVNNAKDGVISGSTIGVLIDDSREGHLLNLRNLGLIESATTAIQGSKATDHIDNLGRVIGDVKLGAGNDIFDTMAKGSSVQGKIYGGTGDDLILVHNAATMLIEKAGQGYDEVTSSVNYTLNANMEALSLSGRKGLAGTGNELDNFLNGSDGNDILKGMAGNDRLFGDVGNDVLTVGSGKDVFNFYTTQGRDRITDFQNGQDRMDIHNWTGMDTFADVKAHASMVSGDLVLKFGADVLTVEGLTLKTMDKTDFIL